MYYSTFKKTKSRSKWQWIMILNEKNLDWQVCKKKKNLDILNDCSGKERKKKNYTHQKWSDQIMVCFFPSLLSRNHINHTKDTVGVTYGHSFLVWKVKSVLKCLKPAFFLMPFPSFFWLQRLVVIYRSLGKRPSAPFLCDPQSTLSFMGFRSY